MKHSAAYLHYFLFTIATILNCGFSAYGDNMREGAGEELSSSVNDSLFTQYYNDNIEDENTEKYFHLTETDFQLVAEELKVDVASIKAVVEIEAGPAMKGFWLPGVPVINFDPAMYAKYKSKVKSKAGDKEAKVPEGLSGYGLKEWTQLVNARKKNLEGADMGTFWGMFQIGGFNYKLCGCKTVQEFVDRMSTSELEQLELFASFITNTGMLEALRKKDWRSFARKYNGASYAKRGYHTKMANAYKKYSNK